VRALLYPQAKLGVIHRLSLRNILIAKQFVCHKKTVESEMRRRNIIGTFNEQKSGPAARFRSESGAVWFRAGGCGVTLSMLFRDESDVKASQF
jgi:hypothetical protein